MLYIIKKDKVDINAIETQNGFRCLIEDISESGALIRIGGKGVQNVKIKLQYNIQNKLILMVGVVRTVEFNEEQNQSLLHFECTHIENAMRNEVLKFVYNMMPQNEKEVLEALEQTEVDEKALETGKNLDEEGAIAEDLANATGAPVKAEAEAAATAGTGSDAATTKPTDASGSASVIAQENKTAAVSEAVKPDPDKNIGISNEDEINVF